MICKVRDGRKFHLLDLKMTIKNGKAKEEEEVKSSKLLFS